MNRDGDLNNLVDTATTEKPGKLYALDFDNLVTRGNVVDLTRKDPTLVRVKVAAGWEHKAFEGELLDVDLSVFLLDRTGKTRVDEDFIFYNNGAGSDGAVRHLGDSRTGAGDGDDETILIDLNGLPFDILKVVFVLSVHEAALKDQNMGMVKNCYLRIVNTDTSHEMLRYITDDDNNETGTALLVGHLERDGPYWLFEARGEPIKGGLAEIATEYGLIIA